MSTLVHFQRNRLAWEQERKADIARDMRRNLQLFANRSLTCLFVADD